MPRHPAGSSVGKSPGTPPPKPEGPTRLEARSAVLKLLRRSYNLTQETAAAVVGVHGDTWARWETGKNPIDQLRLEGVLALFRKWAPRRYAAMQSRGVPRRKRIRPAQRRAP